MKYRIKNIRWDTDGENPSELGLPKSVTVDHTELNLDPDFKPDDIEHHDLGDDLYLGDTITDWLSDTYGWLVEGFDFRPLPASKKPKKQK